MGYIDELRALIGHKRINLPGSVVILENDCHQILMQQRKYPYGKWGLPGGLMELGESFEETARREVFEETGLTIGRLELIDVYSGKDYLCIAQNGDEFYTVMAAFHSSTFDGVLSVHDEESLAVKWIDKDALPDNITKSHQRVINDYFKGLRRMI